MTILPAFKKSEVNFKYIASQDGFSGTVIAKKHGISVFTTDHKDILVDNDVELVMITTYHNLHAKMVMESLNAGKNMFVEKTLALREKELQQIIEVFKNLGMLLTVGSNRCYSSHIKIVKSIVGNSQMNVIATMNTGFTPPNVCVQDMKSGGARII